MVMPAARSMSFSRYLAPLVDHSDWSSSLDTNRKISEGRKKSGRKQIRSDETRTYTGLMETMSGGGEGGRGDAENRACAGVLEG